MVNEGQESAMMGGAGHVAQMEGVLFVAIRGGGCGSDGLCAAKGMIGVYEMSRCCPGENSAMGRQTQCV